VPATYVWRKGSVREGKIPQEGEKGATKDSSEKIRKPAEFEGKSRVQ